MRQIRALCLLVFFAFSTILFSVLTVLFFPFVYPIDRQRHALHQFGVMWAKSVFLVSPWKAKLTGKENLAKKGEAVVYVANHQSGTDILVAFLLGTRFRWLSKASVFNVPLMGWAMRAIGYVGVVRGDRKSHEECMRKLGDLLDHKTPVFFFPEGTRSVDGVLKPFKSGAFRLAIQHKVPVVPISFIGTDKLLPKGSKIPHDADIELIVHPRIESIGKSPDELALEAFHSVASSLPPEKRGQASVRMG